VFGILAMPPEPARSCASYKWEEAARTDGEFQATASLSHAAKRAEYLSLNGIILFKLIGN